MEQPLHTIASFGTLISIILGVGFGILLLVAKKQHRIANRFLGMVPIVLALWQCWLVINTNGLTDTIIMLRGVPFSFFFAIGPLLYLYTKNRFSETVRVRWSDAVHCIPLIIEWTIFYFNYPEGPFDDYRRYSMVSSRFLLPFFGAISIIIYCFIASKIATSKESRPWKRKLLIFGGLWSLYLGYSLINALRFNAYISDYDTYPFFMTIWFFTLWATLKALLSPDLVTVIAPKKVKRSDKETSPALLERANWLKSKMETEEYYLDPELTLQSLANELGIPANTISQTINDGLNKSFSDFVNEYRIDSVIQKFKNTMYDNVTILGMAYDSGFNSKTTFNRTFKKMTGTTPAAYKEKIPVD